MKLFKVFLLICLGLPLFASGMEPIVIFDRKLDEKTLPSNARADVTKQYFQKNLSLDDIVKEYSSINWSDEILKVELMKTSRRDNIPPVINNPEYKLDDGQPFFVITYRREILYENPNETALREKYQIHTTNSGYNGVLTFADMRSKFESIKLESMKYGPNGILRAELQGYTPIQKEPSFHLSPKLIMETISSKKRDDAKFVSNERREYLMKKFAIGKDLKSFTYQEAIITSATFGGGLIVVESFKSNDTGSICAVEHYESMESAISLHDFMRRFVRDPARVEISKYGPVVVVEIPIHLKSMTKLDGIKRIIWWVSSSNHVINVSTWTINKSETFNEIFQYYGDRFPSTLPKDFKIDKADWAKDDQDHWINVMRDQLNSIEQDPYDWKPTFYTAYSNFCRNIEVPKENGVLSNRDYDSVRAKEVFENIEKWWQANKFNVTWEEKWQKLVSKSSE